MKKWIQEYARQPLTSLMEGEQGRITRLGERDTYDNPQRTTGLKTGVTVRLGKRTTENGVPAVQVSVNGSDMMLTEREARDILVDVTKNFQVEDLKNANPYTRYAMLLCSRN